MSKEKVRGDFIRTKLVVFRGSDPNPFCFEYRIQISFRGLDPDKEPVLSLRSDLHPG